MKLLSSKMAVTPIVCKIYVILSKSDNVIENIQIHISSFFDLKFCTNVKKINEKRIFDHFSFLRKKSLDFQKIENHVYWFCFGDLNLKKRKVPRTCDQLM
jgi:hypothetical protein